MAESSLPPLPKGDFSALSTLSQSLSFHSSPESFIASRIEQSRTQLESINPDAPKPIAVRARILNRNVAVISSSELCNEILKVGGNAPLKCIRPAEEGETISRETFAVAPAYRELMADWFPPPNLLLEDGETHAEKRRMWDAQLTDFPNHIARTVRAITEQHLEAWRSDAKLDLYEDLKALSWKILLSVFLDLVPSDKKHAEIEASQETLLRGQFSLFPVSVNTPFWRSARSRGLDTRKKLQGQLADHFNKAEANCPILRGGKCTRSEIASNSLLFTSSISVKACAALMTATFANIFLKPEDLCLADRILQEGPENGKALLRSTILETERLSPPVVGIMRRVQQDVVLCDASKTDQVLVPKGWDVWLYFVSASRDPKLYPEPNKFIAERYVASEGLAPPLAFGAGSKSCLAKDTIRFILQSVIQTTLDAKIRLQGEVGAKGVRGWLGWETDVDVEAIARDLKQLPCQRPKQPIMVQVVRTSEG
ncbi:hypothetical protein MMC25_004136 [Agyrium rufum]|nr:hypothetical protein [Agyrium rufum]